MARDYEVESSPGLTASEGYEGEPCLGDDMEVHLQHVRLTEPEIARRHCVRNALTKVVSALWPAATVKCYGSFAYGLSTSLSPLDLVVEGCESLENFSSVLTPISETLTVKRLMQGKHEAMLRATFKEDPALSVNISFFESGEMSPARESACMVRRWVAQYPAIRPVVAVVRTILQKEGVHCFTTYQLLLCVMSVCKVSPDPSDPGVLLVDFLDRFGQNTDASTNVVTLGGCDVDLTPITIVDPVTGCNIASHITSLDTVRFRSALRKRLHRLNDWVTCRALHDRVFDAMFSDEE
eukprot:TRINITY_DN23499_c0_g1_i1.p1 TRINITY_DN23499_c0_g1~~TRINITY_DN23499_c0_g1_i1.p1  ORF type:complete len:295 (+),score=66.83 TRINITY_DN23499_c0_g1_i1:33-917(+)